MPLGLTQSGYYSGMDKSFDERLRDNKVRQQAAAQGKSVKDFLEDREYYGELASIKADEAREDEAERMMDAQGYMPPAKEPTVGGLEDLGGEALSVIQAEARMREREFKENQTPNLSPETELTGESINPWNVNESSETGEYAIGHSPWSGPAEEPSVGGLEDLGREAHSKSNVDAALKRMRIREYEENQNPPSLSPETELTGESINPWDANVASETGGQGPVEADLINQETTLDRQEMDSEALDDFHQDPRFNPPPPKSSEQLAQEGLDEPGGLLDDLRAETQAGEFGDVGRDEESPPVKQMKDVQKKAANGDPNAEKTRKEIFKGMSKEETAMAKEELGNYYIGPGGFAIDLDEVNKSLSREGDFQLLQHLPDHAKPYMLMKMGYINKEDYEGMPESPEFRTEEMKLINALELDKGKTERTKITGKSGATIATIQTEAQKIMAKGKYESAKDIKTMDVDSREKITKMGIDYNLLKDRSIELMALNDNDLEREIATMQNTTANEEIQAHSRRLTKQLNSNEKIKNWDIDAQKVLQADSLESQSALAKELKRVDQNITREQIAGVRQNLISQLKNDKELGVLGIDAQKLIAGDKNETERYRITSAKTVDLKKIRQAGEHFTKEIAFKYKELGANTDFKNAQLGQMSAVEMLKHNRQSEEQRQTWFVRQHTANQQVANKLFDTGQVEAAMMIMARNGVSNPPNIKAYWKERGVRMEDSDAVKSAALGLKLSVKEANKGYLKALNAEHNKLISTKLDDDEYTELDRAVIQAGEKPWSQMSDNERAEQVDSAGRPIQSFLHWQATKIQDALDRRIKLGPYGKYHAAMKSDEMEIQLKAGQKEKQKKNGKTKPTDEVSTSISEMEE